MAWYLGGEFNACTRLYGFYFWSIRVPATVYRHRPAQALNRVRYLPRVRQAGVHLGGRGRS